MLLTDNITTVLSGFLLGFTTIIPTCERIYISTIALVFSSLFYKYIYVYHSQKKNLLALLTKIDHICIMNLFLSYFDTIQLWQSSIVRILTIINYKFMYIFFGYFMFNLFFELIYHKCYFLGIIFTISTIIALSSYFNYIKKGWTKYNSWLWHYAHTCIIISVKLSSHNLNF